MIASYRYPIVVSESSLGQLRVYWNEWRVKRYLQIRYWYQNKKNGNWEPTTKGIAIPEACVISMLIGLTKILKGEAESKTLEKLLPLLKHLEMELCRG